MSKTARQGMSTVIVLLLLLMFAGVAALLFALNAQRGLSFVIGIGWALVLTIVVKGAMLLWRRGHKALVGLAAVLCFLAANLVIMLLIAHPQQSFWNALKSLMVAVPGAPVALSSIQGRSLSRDAISVTDYQMTLTPVDQTLAAFHVHVNMRLREHGQDRTVGFTQPDPVRLTPSPRGWLLREARLALPDRTQAHVVWKDGDVTRQAEQVCCFRPVTIVLQDLPTGAFYQARDSGAITIATYANIETITWVVHDAWGEREFAEFALIASPFSRLPLIRRLAALSSVADWVFTLGGMLGSTLLASLLLPVFHDLGRQRVKQALTGKKRPTTSDGDAGRPQGDNSLAPLAQHLSARLSRPQLAALRDEIDKFLPPASDQVD
jgi:hypothetical protein